MAVIRAKLLWATAVQPYSQLVQNAAVIPGGVTGDPPDRFAAPDQIPQTPEGLAGTKVLYTVPAGKRAIIRGMNTAQYSQPPGGEEPVFRLYLFPPGQGGVLVRHFWWVRHLDAVAEWKLEDNWTGTIVLHAGWRVEMQNSSTVDIHTQGSGHELNELT